MLSDQSKISYDSVMEVGLRSIDIILDASVYIEKGKSNLNINIPLKDITIMDVGKSDIVFEIARQWLIDNSESLDKLLKEKEILWLLENYWMGLKCLHLA